VKTDADEDRRSTVVSDEMSVDANEAPCEVQCERTVANCTGRRLRSGTMTRRGRSVCLPRGHGKAERRRAASSEGLARVGKIAGREIEVKPTEEIPRTQDCSRSGKRREG